MLQLDNDTPLAAALAALPDEDGVDALFVCVKATFTMRPTVALAAQQLAIARVDLHLGEPNASSLIEAGEHHLGKAGTDVVLHGCAHAEGGRAVTQAAVSVAVAERSKSIAVFGDREFRSLDRVSSPAPFVELPLVYERALGGRVDGGDAWVRELSAHNPVGVGIDRRAGAPVPNLEDPRAPIEGGGERPRAVGFGPIAPGWRPRAQFAGTYDAQWVRKRSPLLPADFDRRFFNVAPAELVFPRFLAGGEPVVVLGASRQGPLRFTLPTIELAIEADVGGGWRSMSACLETVALWPDDDSFSMSWRAKLSCDRKLLAVERVSIGIARSSVEVA
ncbi:MAG: DUF2169 domain-containing protein [Deltaproteobacteria bacterium]|nr:DUF2169 domain-containing protein [Deltaproteobacteria bacterium]MBK8240748.1 DUF2169 domain-containing protein [Deltaproteobacteria bacterium]MBK8714255.1 DUF2169 domain-containing protein [Deltaproteobacteria bacterium]MBP7285955.1 DUF2169 domain-containing protein [Nannocystaceae bacterium]